MYCVKCGVELADSEKCCPLCGIKVVCPEGMTREDSPSPYPPHPGKVTEGMSRSGALFITTFLFIVPIIICLMCDIGLNNRLNWSGYAVGGMLVTYVVFILPLWFRHANPVIFTPTGFLAAGLYLLYICLETGGNWFLSFALPVLGVTTLIISAVVTLVRYVRGGRLYIYGGATIGFGFLTVLIEMLIYFTFGAPKMIRWSPYPFVAFFLLGMMLIIIAICRPLRESLKRRLFF